MNDALDNRLHNKLHREDGWVIEGAWSHVTTPDYWQGSSAWGSDPYLALRFARKLDAERAASLMLDGVKVRIREHWWADARSWSAGGRNEN